MLHRNFYQVGAARGYILGGESAHGANNITPFNKGLASHGDSALDVSNHRQPIWFQPRVKVATNRYALGHAESRIKGIATELGLKFH